MTTETNRLVCDQRCELRLVRADRASLCSDASTIRLRASPIQHGYQPLVDPDCRWSGSCVGTGALEGFRPFCSPAPRNKTHYNERHSRPGETRKTRRKETTGNSCRMWWKVSFVYRFFNLGVLRLFFQYCRPLGCPSLRGPF